MTAVLCPLCGKPMAKDHDVALDEYCDECWVRSNGTKTQKLGRKANDFPLQRTRRASPRNANGKP